MRIAYVCHWNLDDGDGVAKKVETQARLWREAGHDATIFSLAPGEAQDRDGIRAFPYGAVSRRSATSTLARAVRAFAPDLVYLRYDLFLPPIWRLARKAPTVVEVNSDDRAEYRRFVAFRGRRALVYNEVNRRRLLGAAKGLVFVTGELAASPNFFRYDVPSTVIANGIELGNAPTPAPGHRLRAVFLGTAGQAWHGVDKLATLAREAPELDIDLVGYTEEQLRATVADVPGNLRVHGRLSRSEYEPLLAAADAGIGTLALHRKDMREAAPLKVREYLAAGLPVVIAYDDVDLAGIEPWWILRLPNDEANVAVHVERIRAYLETVRGRRVPREEVEALISWAAKERVRLAFLSGLARA